ncbi:MAG: hypothetical protein IKQ78_04670 [Bacilli bacterium]|nr:hypothetical protein [Bacilli bacterium]
MIQISKMRKAIVRDAAKALRRKMAPNLDYYDQHPWKFMPEYEFEMGKVCVNKAEEDFFELIFVFGSEKAIREFSIFLQGVQDGLKAQEEEANVPKA